MTQARVRIPAPSIPAADFLKSHVHFVVRSIQSKVFSGGTVNSNSLRSAETHTCDRSALKDIGLMREASESGWPFQAFSIGLGL